MDFLDIISWKFYIKENIKACKNYERLQSVLISNIDQVCFGFECRSSLF